jgi:Xaa-Pro aminopeptidase
MRQEEAASLLVTSETNVSYLSGFSGDSSALILTAGRAFAVTDGRYGEQFARECPGLEVHVRPVGQPLMAGVAEVLAKLGAGCSAFEAPHLTVAQHQALAEAAPTIALRGVGGWVEALRMVKDDVELAAIRDSIAVAERAFAELRPQIQPGRTEKDLADSLEFAMRRRGATAAAFPPIVAVGRRAALPHARPSPSARAGDDDFLLIDWGASGRPYKSDLTRMVVTGTVTPMFERVYRAVLEAQTRAIDAIRPGTSARAIDAEARASLKAAGLGESFSHSLGHGIGMDIHEMPFLGRDPDVELRPGMVMTVEPGVYLPDWGGVRIEDDVLVTPEGCEVLTGVPKDLDSVRLGT